MKGKTQCVCGSKKQDRQLQFNAILEQSLDEPSRVLNESKTGLSVSCLQMVNCHNFTHFCAVSLKMFKSSREQGVLSSGHCGRCSIVCVSVPQLHEGSPVWYPHCIKFALVRPTPNLSRLSVFHVGQGALLLGGRLSDGLNSHIDRAWVGF